ncbi:MAG: YdbL family protein [Colwellia sp.]|nr:YdbL family protein [Colwellia sp.]MCW8865002.1 YdbL family protein [Colwellia sp.]MCW9080506.1 YdbL family protein [Colwellia sp.]
MYKFIKKFSLAMAALSITFSAWAISLDQAKQQGLVGEMANGYLGVVVTSPEVTSLVASVNAKRKSLYLDIARKNKLTMKQVTALAGEKAIAKTSSGHYIKMPSGGWIKK